MFEDERKIEQDEEEEYQIFSIFNISLYIYKVNNLTNQVH